MEHILEKHKAELCQLVKSVVYVKRSNEGSKNVQVRFAHHSDIPHQAEIFRRYYNEFVSIEASLDVKTSCMLDLANSLCVTVHSNAASTKISVVGRKRDVEIFLASTNKDSRIQVELELPPDKLALLESLDYLSELEKSLHVEIRVNKEKIRASGPERNIKLLGSKLNLRMQDILHSNIQITDSIWKFLQCQEACTEVSNLLHNNRVVCTFSKLNKTISFFAMSQKDLGSGIERFKQAVVEEEVPLTESEASFIMSQKGFEVVEKLFSSTKFMLLERSQRIFKFTGLANECFAAKDQLTKILKENAFVTKILPFSLGKTRAVLTICKESMENLLQGSSNNHVSVNESEDGCSIKVTGYGRSVNYVVQQIGVISKSIRQETLVLQRPGLSKVIELDSSKHMISSLEKEKDVVILRREEDRKAVIFREELKRTYDTSLDRSSSELICTYQISGKTRIMKLSVYKGDIRKQRADAIVNLVNPHSIHSGRVADAILDAGSNAIQEECYNHAQQHGPLSDGDVFITDTGRLPCRKIIHAVVPHWPNDTKEMGEQELYLIRKTSKEVLSEMIGNVLKAAEANYCSFLAFPAISRGIFRFPKALSAEILTKTTVEILQNRPFFYVKEVHFVSIDAPTIEVFIDEFNISFGERCVVSRKRMLCGRQQQNPDGILESNNDTAKSNRDEIKFELSIGDLGKVKVLLHLLFPFPASFLFDLVNHSLVKHSRFSIFQLRRSENEHWKFYYIDYSIQRRNFGSIRLGLDSLIEAL